MVVALIVAIVAIIATQNRNDEVLGFTKPEDLSIAQQVASDGAHTGPLSVEKQSRSINIAPTQRSTQFAGPSAVSHIPLADLLAGKTGTVPTVNTPATFYPGNLGLDTRLTYRGVTSTIVGVISFDLAGVTWQDYVVERVAGQWWRFGVEPTKGMKLDAFEPCQIALEPGPPTLHFDGSTFVLQASGKANYKAIGRTMQFPSGKYWYFDYENDAGAILSFEQFDGGLWTTSLGHHVDPHAVTVDNLPIE